MVTIEEARTMVLDAARPLAAEEVAIPAALGRALAESIVAPADVPSFTNSSMDGYAVRSEDIVGAGEGAPIRLVLCGTIAAGQISPHSLAPGEAARIMTGAALPHPVRESAG
jgi:molybdopterin molybdotransferase